MSLSKCAFNSFSSGVCMCARMLGRLLVDVFACTCWRTSVLTCVRTCVLVYVLFRELAHLKEEKDRMLSEKQAEFDHMLDVSIRSQKALVVEVCCDSSLCDSFKVLN